MVRSLSVISLWVMADRPKVQIVLRRGIRTHSCAGDNADRPGPVVRHEYGRILRRQGEHRHSVILESPRSFLFLHLDQLLDIDSEVHGFLLGVSQPLKLG